MILIQRIHDSYRSLAVFYLAGLLPVALLAESSLRDGLIGYSAFDGDLSFIHPGGEMVEAEFTRHSRAYKPDLSFAEENEPRYVPGRFDWGIMVEPGYESARKYAARNYLAPEVAQIAVTKDGALPFIPMGDASLGLTQGPSGLHLGTGQEVLEGGQSLTVECQTEGSGVQARQAVSVVDGKYTFSLFVIDPISEKEKDTLRLELADDNGTVLGAAKVSVGAVWSRVQLEVEIGRFTRDTKKQKRRAVQVRIRSTRAGQAFRVDGLVLEMRGGYSYAGTGEASSWLPGHGYRASEVLSIDSLRYLLRKRTGSIVFWAKLLGGKQSWRTLFEIGGTNRWQPFLQLKFRPNPRLWLGGKKEKPTDVVANVAVEPGQWHHYGVTWTSASAAMYLDAEKVGEIKGVEIPERLPHLRLGSAGPNAAANGVFDEALVYNRALEGEEVERLAKRKKPFRPRLSSVFIRPARFLETIAHTARAQSWKCSLVNCSERKLKRSVVTFALGPHLRVPRRVGALKSGRRIDLDFRFVPDLMLGTYPLTVTAITGGRVVARFERTVEITPAAEPFENLQVSPWGFNSKREYGFTFGGGDIEDGMRDGLYWSPLWHYLGYPREVDGQDWVHGMNDVPFRPSFSSPYMRAQVEREGERLSKRFAAIPSMRGITLSSEEQWIWQHDFSPERVKWIKEKFHLDISPWHFPPKKGGVDAFQTPFGRLKPSVAGRKLPEDRVLKRNDRFYAYHRWFHGSKGLTESYLNQALSDRIHARRPDILTIQEPILRRAAVRAFRRVSIAQEWFYYEDPMWAVMVQERLNAATRGTNLRPTGMPQFLFKKGSAAPFNAIATADLFHETVWLCALQPIRMFTYWNFRVVPSADFENYYSRCTTKAALDKLFGSPTPTWEQAEAALKANPKFARKLMPWTPGLFETFKKFHLEEVGPLGGLISCWHNRPRRIAILRSFASQLYSEVRWPNTSWLENCAIYSGVPFDVLYDEDFEGRHDPLGQYQLVIVSGAVCLTRPAFRSLAKFSKRGGLIVADEKTLVELPGAVVLKSTESFEGHKAAFAARERQLKERYGSVDTPAYVEAMAESAPQLPSRVEPAFLELLKHRVVPEARSFTPDTWLNLLEAEGANYLGVVNNLRTFGPMYGHFGKVRGTGIAQTARIMIDPALGQVAYDLLSGQRVELLDKGERYELRLALPPGGAGVLVLLPRTIERMSAQAETLPVRWGEQEGREARITASLYDTRGRPVPGLIPATVTIEMPNGKRSDFSRHTVFRRGRLEVRFPVPANAHPGQWKVTIFERASGKSYDVSLEEK